MSRKKTWDVIVERDVTVPMRDGVNLVADLYFPAADGRPLEGELPAVLQRTPYKKESYENMGSFFFAKHGYLSVVQDCRGRFKSGGDFFPFRDEPQDGYDTVVWLANHPVLQREGGYVWLFSHGLGAVPRSNTEPAGISHNNPV